MKKPLADIRDDLNDVSQQVSTQVRALTLGVLAITWLALSGSDEIKAFDLSGDWQLAAIALLCILTLAVDLAQYVFGYELVCRTLMAAEKAGQQEAAYSRKSWWHRLRRFAYGAKQVLAAAAAFWLLIALSIHIVTSANAPAPVAAPAEPIGVIAPPNGPK